VSLALQSRGHVLFGLGRADEGCIDLEEARSIQEAALDPSHPTLAVTLLGLGECHALRGDVAGALDLELRALAIREAKLGRAHPKTAEALERVGGRYATLHDDERARPLLERARTILATRVPPSH
jgi:tetratricopeptide (TPR) repeat protein